jgi:hypothetical protein
MLRRWLQTARSAHGVEAETARHLLRIPWCWPADPDLAERAVDLGASPPPPPRPGESLLVSTTPDRPPRTALWIVVPGPARSYDEVPLRGEAHEALLTALRRATSELPYAVDLGATAPGRSWSARRASVQWPHPALVLDGASFGAGLLLAVGSAVMGVPLPPDMVVLATLSSDGRFDRVDGLREKIERVRDDAPGVRRLAVARGQGSDACDLVEDLGATIDVVEIENAGDLWRAVYPGDAPNPEAWGIPEARRSAAASISALVADPAQGALDWRAVARGAKRLAAVLSAGAPEAAAVREAEAIALRHADNSGRIERPTDDDLRAMPLARRLGVLSQFVQSEADAGSPTLAKAVEFAAEYVGPPRESDVAGLRLHGALGRAQSLLGLYGDAIERLRGTVECWLAAGEPGEASRPLCALALAAGLADRLDALAAADATARDLLDRLVPDSRAFVRLAIGRAHVQAGDAGEAAKWLEADTEAWDAARDDVRAAGLRWLGNARAALGDAQGAAEARRRAREVVRDRDVQALLVQLDERLQAGDEPGSITERLAASEALFAFFARPGESLAASARRMAREYPY